MNEPAVLPELLAALCLGLATPLAGAATLPDHARARIAEVPFSHEAGITSMAFTPDSDRLLTLAGFELGCWARSSGERQWQVLLPGRSPPRVLACSPSGSTLAVGSLEGGEVALLQTSSGGELGRLVTGLDAVDALAFHPEGRALAVSGWRKPPGEGDFARSGASRVLVLSLPEGARLHEFPGQVRTGPQLLFSRRGEVLFAGGRAGVIQRLDLQDGVELPSLAVSRVPAIRARDGREAIMHEVSGLALAAGGEQLVAAVRNEALVVLDLATATERTRSTPLAPPPGEARPVLTGLGTLCVHPHAPRAWTDAGGMVALDLDGGAVLGRLRGSPNPVSASTLSPDGRWLAAAPFEGPAGVWDADRGERVLGSRETVGAILSVAYFPQGDLVATSDVAGVRVFSTSDGREHGSARHHGGVVQSVAVDADGERLASCSADGRIRLFSVRGGSEPLVELRAGARDLRFVRFLPTSSRADEAVPSLVSVARDGRVGLWDPASPTPLAELDAGVAPVFSAALSADGRRLAVGGGGGGCVLELPSGKVLLAFRSGGLVCSLDLSASGDELVVASRDQRLRVLSVPSGRPHLELDLDDKEFMAFVTSKGLDEKEARRSPWTARRVPGQDVLVVQNVSGYLMTRQASRGARLHTYDTWSLGEGLPLEVAPAGDGFATANGKVGYLWELVTTPQR